LNLKSKLKLCFSLKAQGEHMDKKTQDKVTVIFTDNPPFNQKGEVEKKETKPEADSLYGGNPAVMADAIEQTANVRKLLKDRLKPVKDNAEAFVEINATEKVRLQGSNETKAPSLKPYTEEVDVKDRAELSKRISEARKQNKSFKIGRSMKEGYRYTILVEADAPKAGETKPGEIKVGKHIKIIDMVGEPTYKGKVGRITDIDDAGQLHGTWGGLAIIPDQDKFELVTVFDSETNKVLEKKMTTKMEGAPEEHHHDEEHQDEGEYDEEGDMAKSDLQIMADAALELHAMLQDEENLPEWVQAKITLATDYIDTARDYMKAKKEGTELPEPEEGESLEVIETEPLKESVSGSWGTEIISLQDFATAVEELGNDDIDFFPILKGIAAGTHRAFVKHEGKDVTITVLRGDVVEMTLTSKKEEAVTPLKEEMGPRETKFFPGEDGDTEAHIFIEDKGIQDYDLVFDEKKNGYVLTWEMEDELLESKEEKKDLKEEAKIISSLDEYEPWSGAVSTWDKIVEANKVDQLDFLLTDLYPEGMTMTELNDILWFESDWVLGMLGISDDGQGGQKEKPRASKEPEDGDEEESDSEEDYMSMLNDIEDEEPVMVVLDDEDLEESKHSGEMKESSGSVVKEVQDYLKNLTKK